MACGEAIKKSMKVDKHIKTFSLEKASWADKYPYKPEVSVSLAHDSDYIFCEFEVDESISRAQALDMGRVWEDSCVELFISPFPEDGIYYNFECNCIGSLLLCAGKGRHERLPAPEDVLSKVHRFSSLPRETFECKSVGPWKVALMIPKSAFFLHEIKSFDGLSMKANFYKCGDLLPSPHFISYSVINTPEPDFHRPEFFIDLDLE